MQRVTSFATCRELGGLATWKCLVCPWEKRSSPRQSQYRSWDGTRSTRPLFRETFTVNSSSLHKLRRQSALFASQKYRHYCTSENDRNGTTGHPTISVVGIPDPITWIRNKVIIYLVELYFELGLTTGDFDNGVKQALVFVSNLMSNGNFRDLRGVVSKEMVEYAETKCNALTEAQRRQLAISLDDIIFTLPENVSVVFDQNGRKYCFIEMRFWHLSTANRPDDPEGLKIFKIATTEDGAKPQKIVTAVYEFHRELTTGADSEWTVTNIWHWNWERAWQE